MPLFTPFPLIGLGHSYHVFVYNTRLNLLDSMLLSSSGNMCLRGSLTIQTGTFMGLHNPDRKPSIT